MLSIKTILHPHDFSEQSKYALHLACSVARDYNAQVLVLHVGATPVVGYGIGVIPPDPQSYEKELHEKLFQLKPADPKVSMEHMLVLGGDPAPEILNVAKERECDLIVMGTHGWTGLTRLLMGSVAEQVVRKATCPVLTVKMPQPDAAEAAAEKETVEAGQP